MAKFNKLDVPYQWRDEFTKYPHGYTIFEALCKWVKQVDNMVDNINTWNVYLDNFVEKFDSELQEEVQSTIDKWQNEGLLDGIIESALSTELDNIKTQLVYKANQIDLEKTNIDLSAISINKVDKNGAGQVTWAMAAQDFREQITGGNTAVVGVDSVAEVNIVDHSVTPRKISVKKDTLATELFEFEIGGINMNDGSNQNKDYRIRSSVPVLIAKGTIIKSFAHNDSFASLVIYSSDNISDYVGKANFLPDGTYRPVKDEYVRLFFGFYDNRTLDLDEINMDNIITVKEVLLLENENIMGLDVQPKNINSVQQITPSYVFKDFVIGGLSTDSGTSNTRQNRLRNNTPIFFKKGTSFSIKKDKPMSMMINLYASEDLASFITSPSAVLGYGFHKKAYTLQDDYYVRVMIRFDDDRDLEYPQDIDVDDTLEIKEHIFIEGENLKYSSVEDKHLSESIKQKIKPNPVIYPKYEEINKPFRTSQDACMVGNEIWYFLGADAESEIAEIRIMDKTTYEYVGTKHHNLGHANSVSYLDDILITYDNPNGLYLYEGAKEKDILLKEDEECHFLDLSTLGITELGGSACFGENLNYIYYIGYDGNNTEAYMPIYKIRLEKIEGNYTMELVDRFEGELHGREYARPQGIDYDGYLYVSAGFSHMHTYKISLDHQYKTYIVLSDFVINKGVQIESQSTVIDGPYALVSGFTNGGPDYVFKFRI